MWFLAGLPGKLKVLVDRLTSTRAANLDNLNATVSSRAPASTALSNAVWTDTRAGKLDGVERAVVSRSPTAIVPFTQGAEYNTAGTYNVLNLTGAGVLNLAVLRMQAGTGQSGNANIKITIDGVVVANVNGVVGSGQTVYTLAAGFYNGTLLQYDQIPYQSSLLVQLLVNSGVAQCRIDYAYRTVGSS